MLPDGLVWWIWVKAAVWPCDDLRTSISAMNDLQGINSVMILQIRFGILKKYLIQQIKPYYFDTKYRSRNRNIEIVTCCTMANQVSWTECICCLLNCKQWRLPFLYSGVFSCILQQRFILTYLLLYCTCENNKLSMTVSWIVRRGWVRTANKNIFFKYVYSHIFVPKWWNTFKYIYWLLTRTSLYQYFC